jgi:iron(III) transport system ATP-binding protein
MSGIEVADLTKIFDDHVALDGLNLTVPEGSLTAVLGPSGSGKTTLLRILAGFERADAGSITIGTEVVEGGDGRRFVAPKRRGIGYVSQEGALFPHLSVAKNVAFGIRRTSDRAHRTRELIDLVGLTGLDHRYPHQLSGGQQQRVALARALAVGPSLVLLDEPFTSLDAGLRASVRADVRRILKGSGTTGLLVTHDRDEALSWADIVAVLRHGRITQQSTPDEIYARPGDVATARSVGAANLIDGTGEGRSVATPFGSLSLLDGAPPVPEPTPVVVLVRPEQIHVSAGDGGGGPESGAGLAGRITDVEFYGHDIVVTASVDRSCGTDTVSARAAGGLMWAVGDPVTLFVTEPVHVWVREDRPVP